MYDKMIQSHWQPPGINLIVDVVTLFVLVPLIEKI